MLLVLVISEQWLKKAWEFFDIPVDDAGEKTCKSLLISEL